MKCRQCGSYAINDNLHGREKGIDLDYCDVCYWRFRAEQGQAEIKRKDALIEQMRVALLWLYRWVKAEAEHFQANTPDDEIIKEVEAALSATERGE